MATAPAVIGECRIVLRNDADRDFVPPLYLFPELLPFVTHHDSDLSLRSTASLIDRDASSWRLIELQDVAPDHAVAARVQPPSNSDATSVRAKLEALARNGNIDFGFGAHGPEKPAGWVPTSVDLVAALSRLVAAVPGWRQDPDAAAAVVSPHFLNLLAYRQLMEILSTIDAAEGNRVERRATVKKHRAETAQESVGAPSEDPWDATANRGLTSIALDSHGPLPELAETLARISGRVWKSTASAGQQTDLRKPCTKWSEPAAQLPEVVTSPSVAKDAEVATSTPEDQRRWRATVQCGDVTVPLEIGHTTYFGRYSSEENAAHLAVVDGWHINLGADPKVSREAFALHPKWRDGAFTGFALIPMGRNGVTVDRRWHLHTAVAVANGAEIRVGDRVLHLSIETPSDEREVAAEA